MLARSLEPFILLQGFLPLAYIMSCWRESFIIDLDYLYAVCYILNILIYICKWMRDLGRCRQMLFSRNITGPVTQAYALRADL